MENDGIEVINRLLHLPQFLFFLLLGNRTWCVTFRPIRETMQHATLMSRPLILEADCQVSSDFLQGDIVDYISQVSVFCLSLYNVFSWWREHSA